MHFMLPTEVSPICWVCSRFCPLSNNLTSLFSSAVLRSATPALQLLPLMFQLHPAPTELSHPSVPSSEAVGLPLFLFILFQSHGVPIFLPRAVPFITSLLASLTLSLTIPQSQPQSPPEPSLPDRGGNVAPAAGSPHH